MRITLTVELNIPDEDINVNKLEEIIYQKRQEIGKELFGRVLKRYREESL